MSRSVSPLSLAAREISTQGALSSMVLMVGDFGRFLGVVVFTPTLSRKKTTELEENAEK